MAYFHIDTKYDEARYDESNYDNIAITPVERLVGVEAETDIILVEVITIKQERSTDTSIGVESQQNVNKLRGVTTPLFIETTQEVEKKARFLDEITVGFTKEITRTQALDVATLIPFFLERKKDTQIKKIDEYNVKVQSGEEYNVRVKDKDNFTVSRKQNE